MGRCLITCALGLLACTTAKARDICGAPSSFDEKKLEALLETKKDLASVVEALPDAYKSNFTMMRKSRSSQAASEAFPRVIMYGENASFIMAFHGAETGAGAKSIETAKVNPGTGEYEFRVYHIPPDKDDGKVNPSACVGCHG